MFNAQQCNALKEFAHMLNLQWPDIKLNKRTAKLSQGYILQLHIQSFQDKLGEYGYNVDGEEKPLNYFYELAFSRLEGELEIFQRLDTGFGHEGLKQNLSDLLEVSPAACYFSRRGIPKYNFDNILSWPQIYAWESNIQEGWTAEKLLESVPRDIFALIDKYQAAPVSYSVWKNFQLA
jgi:hypothetical protein